MTLAVCYLFGLQGWKRLSPFITIRTKKKREMERTGLMNLGKDECEEDHSVSPKTLTLKLRLRQNDNINKKLTLNL